MVSRHWNKWLQKGKVSLEELNGQLAEALPGASNLAASALGVTRREMFKMAEGGNLLASELLPKFATELERVADNAKVVGSLTLGQEFARMGNAIKIAKVETAAPVLKLLSKALGALNDKITTTPELIELFQLGVIGLVVSLVPLAVSMIGVSMAAAGISLTFSAAALASIALVAQIAAIAAVVGVLIKVVEADPLKGMFPEDTKRADAQIEKLKNIHKEYKRIIEAIDEKNGKEGGAGGRELVDDDDAARIKEKYDTGTISGVVNKIGYALGRAGQEGQTFSSDHDDAFRVALDYYIDLGKAFGKAAGESMDEMLDYASNEMVKESRERTDQFVSDSKEAREALTPEKLEDVKKTALQLEDEQDQLSRTNAAFHRVDDIRGDYEAGEGGSEALLQDAKETAMSIAPHLKEAINDVTEYSQLLDLLSKHRDKEQKAVNKLLSSDSLKLLGNLEARIELANKMLDDRTISATDKETIKAELAEMEPLC